MTIDKDFKGLQDFGSMYYFEGDLKDDEITIELNKPLLVRGSIKSKYNTTSKNSLWVEKDIEGDVLSEKTIIVEGLIKAKNIICNKLVRG